MEVEKIISALRPAPEPELLQVLELVLRSALPQVLEQVLPSALLPLLALVQSSESRPLSVSAY
jgi:hypothetical protein